jgi:hypothetical protein
MPESSAFNTEEYNNKSRTNIPMPLIRHDIGDIYNYESDIAGNAIIQV